MRNVTISLDDETARWARVRAAQCDKSLSRYVAELLSRERHREPEAPPTDGPVDVTEPEYQAAMKRYLSGPLFDLGIDPRPTREELYDRAVFRQ